MKYEIKTYGDEVLRNKAVPVKEVTDEIRELASDMLQTMYLAEGVGLAAEQIGRTEAICVIDVPPDCIEPKYREQNIEMPLVLINPVVSEPEGKNKGKEGCLSFPGLYAEVVRAESVSVEYTDINNQKKKIRVSGFVARAVQHEVDHLNGILFPDRLSPSQKVLTASKVKKIKSETMRKKEK